MKLQNINSTYYINPTPGVNLKGKHTNTTKPLITTLKEPIKKSGKTLGGMILSGLAALGLVSDKTESEQTGLTNEEFENIKKKLYKKSPSSQYSAILDCYLTNNNVPIFRWLLKNHDETKDYICCKIYSNDNWLGYVREVFNTPDIPHEHIYGLMERWNSECNKPEKDIEAYRINKEKIKELTPFVEEYKPQKPNEELNKEVVLNYLNMPPYQQNLSYMTTELLEKFIKESPFVMNYGLDVLFSKDKEEFDFRLNFLKYLTELPKDIEWQNLNRNNDEEYKYYHPNLDLFRYVNKDNLEFIKELIQNKYSVEQIRDITYYTDKDTLETMRTILNDERIIKESKDDSFWRDIYYKAISNIDKNNAKRVLELFNMSKDKEIILGSLIEFTQTPGIAISLCKTYNINPLHVAGKDYISPESAPVVKKIEENKKYNDNVWTIRELAQMASQNREAKDLIEALTDKNCELYDIRNIYRSVFDVRSNTYSIGNHRRASRGKFPAILKIAGNKDLTSKQTEYLLFDCNTRPITFLAKHLENKTIDFNYITQYWRLVNDDNLSITSNLLSNKNFNQKYLADILKNYEKGTNNIIYSVIESGEFDKYPEIAKFPTDSWRYILDNNLKFDEIDKSTISYIARSNNPKLFDWHKQLKNDVYASKNLLKPGLEELTEDDLRYFISDEYTISTLNIVGKGILESTFPETLYGVEDFCEDIGAMNLPNYLYEELALKINPESSYKYINLELWVNKIKKQISELAGDDLLKQKEQIEAKAKPVLDEIKELKTEASNLDDSDERKAQIKQQINNRIKIVNKYKQEVNALYQQSENYSEIKKLMKEVYEKQSEMKNILASKIDLSPQKLAEKIRVIAQLSLAQDNDADEEYLSDFKKSAIENCINLIQPDSPENESKWNEYVNNLIFNYTNFEYNKKLSDKLDFIHSKYISQLFTSSSEFYDNLDVLINYVNDNLDLSIEDLIDNLPQNITTKQQLEKLGVDYEKWTKVDKNSYVAVKVKLDAAEAKHAAIENLEEDLNDEMFNKIPKENSLKVYEKIKQAGFEIRQDKKVIYDENGFNIGQKDFNRIYKNGKPIEFKDLGKIINSIKEQINSDEFWFKENKDEQIENAKEHLYYHLMKMRVPEFENAKNMKDGEEVDIEVHKTNMYDIKKALGLGNDAACCTALGAHSNEWTAPNYIMNKCIGAIELTDRGNFAGNTMIYLANVDGKLSLVLDNIEMKTKYQFNNAIRDAFFEYARKLCAEIGKPDMPIYAGPNRHKIDTTGLEIKNRTMTIIGDTGEQAVYLDFDAESHYIDKGKKYKVDLYRIS